MLKVLITVLRLDLQSLGRDLGRTDLVFSSTENIHYSYNMMKDDGETCRARDDQWSYMFDDLQDTLNT